jgi:hypothetical protein
MLQSAISTVLCVVPLYFSFAYTTRVFFTTISLVTLIGLLHGIVVVPCVFIFISYLRGERLQPEKVPLQNDEENAANEKKQPLDFGNPNLDLRNDSDKKTIEDLEAIDGESTRL